MAGRVMDRCMGSTFGRGHLSHGCVMAFVRMSTEKQVSFLHERKLADWNSPWISFLLVKVGCLSAPGRQTDRPSTFTGVRAFSSNWVTVNAPNTRQEEGYGEPWVVLLLRGHMQGSLAQAWCLCCTPGG